MYSVLQEGYCLGVVWEELLEVLVSLDGGLLVVEIVALVVR
jgi:hypothetical protein